MFSHHIIAYPTLQSKSEIVYNPTHSNEKPYFLKLYTIKYRQRISLYFPMFFVFLYRIFVRSMRLSSATFFVSFLTKSGSSSASFPSLHFRLFFGLAYAALPLKPLKHVRYSSAITSSCFHIHENKKPGGSTIC